MTGLLKSLSRFGVIAGFAIAANIAQAVPITVPFTVEVLNSAPDPVFIGTTGSGSIMYDDGDITGSGDETLGSSDFDVEVMLFGQTFTNSDDIDFPGFPELGFTDGDIVFLDFFVSEIEFAPPQNLIAIDEPNVVFIELLDAFPAPAGAVGLFIPAFVGTPLPEPSTAALFGLAGLIAVRKSRKK